MNPIIPPYDHIPTRRTSILVYVNSDDVHWCIAPASFVNSVILTFKSSLLSSRY